MLGFWNISYLSCTYCAQSAFYKVVDSALALVTESPGGCNQEKEQLPREGTNLSQKPCPKPAKMAGEHCSLRAGLPRVADGIKSFHISEMWFTTIMSLWDMCDKPSLCHQPKDYKLVRAIIPQSGLTENGVTFARFVQWGSRGLMEAWSTTLCRRALNKACDDEHNKPWLCAKG